MHRASLANEVNDCKVQDRNAVWLKHGLKLATVYSHQIQYKQPT